MRTVTIPVVDSEEGHTVALARIRELWLAEDGTDGAAERETLVTLVCAYEEKTDPWPSLPPCEIVRSIMDSHDLTELDLVATFGSPNEVAAFLSGTRPLRDEEAIRLHREYNVPFSLLLQPNGG